MRGLRWADSCMHRYKLTIAYDGTDFCGWQKQEPYVSEAYPAPAIGIGVGNPDPYARVQGLVQREGESRARVQLRTVQHLVERAVREIVREPVVLMGASRTDAGVHARGQVAAFTCSGGDPADAATDASEGEPGSEPKLPGRTGWPLERGINRLKRAINGRLPDDVQVTTIELAGPSFDPIHDCTSKCYTYLLHVSAPPPRGTAMRPLWDRRFVHHMWDELDVEAMKLAAARIVGTRDFAAFAAADHGRENTVRTVFHLDVTKLERVVAGDLWADRLKIEISGSGFLYNMVRIIAGTLAAVGQGKMTPEDVSAAIESKDRRKAGPTLPAGGLCLEWVRY